MMKRIKKICWTAAILGCMLPTLVESTAKAASGTWRESSKGWWYSYSNGTYAKSEWLKDGGKWYFFDSKGYMVTGWKKISNNWYYFAPSGAMVSGWKKISNNWYYFGASGAMVTGWKKLSNKWYYFGAGGAMVTGWQKINNKWYFFTDGVMQTGWKKIGGKTYFFRDGAMVTGTQKIGGINYTFDKNGVWVNLSPDELFPQKTDYFANLGDYYAIFLHIQKDGSFSLGTYDDFLGGNECTGVFTNIVKKNTKSCQMEMSSVSAGNWTGWTDGTAVFLYNNGTAVSSVPSEFLENGMNTSLTFGQDWRQLTTLPKKVLYFDLDEGGYWFELK